MGYKVWLHIEDSDTEENWEGMLPIQVGPQFENVQDAIDLFNCISDSNLDA